MLRNRLEQAMTSTDSAARPGMPATAGRLRLQKLCDLCAGPLRNAPDRQETGGGPVPASRADESPEQPPLFRLSGRRPPGLRWSLNRIALTYLVLAVLLLPWVVLLAVELPDRQLNQHYKLAWVGFDLLLAATLSRTAWLAWRRSPYLVNVASVTAALLVVDAWFDITTADSLRDRYTAIALAGLVELPLAWFSLRLARRAQQLIAARVPGQDPVGDLVGAALTDPAGTPEPDGPGGGTGSLPEGAGSMTERDLPSDPARDTPAA
jgi:hypothetical protein